MVGSSLAIWLARIRMVFVLETAKPVAPQLVAPEAVPPDAVAADACWRRWQDNKGNWHKRRVC